MGRHAAVAAARKVGVKIDKELDGEFAFQGADQESFEDHAQFGADPDARDGVEPVQPDSAVPDADLVEYPFFAGHGIIIALEERVLAD